MGNGESGFVLRRKLSPRGDGGIDLHLPARWTRANGVNAHDYVLLTVSPAEVVVRPAPRAEGGARP